MSSLRFQEQSLEVWKQETIPLNCYIATKIIQPKYGLSQYYSCLIQKHVSQALPAYAMLRGGPCRP
jgi:hypothetical protein